MTRQTDELDRLIDALNYGDQASANAVTDPEIAALMTAVIRIRRLQTADSPEEEWPERAVLHLSRELRADEPSVSDRTSSSPEPNLVENDVQIGPPMPAPVHPATEPPKRRTIPREFAQIAAAILVLVLVGGVLAAVFHDQGGSNQGDVGAGDTPTTATGSFLPMTVTANGVTVELQSVDSTSTATRFTFIFQMSPDQVSHDQPFPSILGSKPADDVTIDGITPAPNDPYVTELGGIANNPNIGFTLDYQSPFPPDKTVIITIQHLTLPARKDTPVPNQAGGSQPVDGPWTFTIPPDAVANQLMPTPAHAVDRFAGVSATQAQKWSSFPITAPSPLPAVLSNAQVLKRNEFNVNGYGLGVPETAAANYVLFNYEQPLGQAVFLVETTNAAAVPNISGDSATLLMPDESSGKTGTWAISPGTLSHPMIDGVIITRFEVSTSADNGPMLVYVWKLGAVDYLIWHMTDATRPGMATVTDDDLQQMVTSIIKQRGGDTLPAPSGAVTPTRQAQASPSTSAAIPTPNANGVIVLTFPQAEQISPFYVAQPQWVPSYLQFDAVTVGGANPPGTALTPDHIHFFTLDYQPADGSHQYSLQILEHGGTFTTSYGPGTPSTVTIAEHSVDRFVSSTTIPLTYFTWQDQGTTFQITAQVAGPLTEQDVERMIASMLDQGSGQATSTPSGVSTPVGSGSDTNLTVAQAQNLVGFKIIEPKSLPTPLASKPISVAAYHVGNSGTDKANYVEIFYPPSQSASRQGMFLVETTNDRAVSAIKGETASIFSPNGAQRTMTIIRGTEAKMGIQGVVVTKFDVADSDSRQTYLVWTNHGVSSYVEVMMSGQNTNEVVNEDELRQMVGSMINQRQSPPLVPESVIADVLSVVRGLILAFILVAVYRMRHRMLFSWAVFVIVALFTAFLFVDGIVSVVYGR